MRSRRMRVSAAVGCLMLLCVVPAGAAGALPPAKEYNLRPPEWRLPTAEEQRVLDILNARRASHFLDPWLFDANLSETAREHSEDMAKHSYFGYYSPRLGSFGYRLHRSGFSGSHWRQAMYQLPSIGSLKTHLEGKVVPFIISSGTHLGIGIAGTTVPRGKLVTLITTKRDTELDSFPITPDRSSMQRLTGSLAKGLKNPHVVITFPDGSTGELKPAAARKQAFRFEVDFRKGAGEYIVELLAEGKLGVQVTDIMKVYVETKYPPPDSEPPIMEVPSDLRAAEKMMLDLVNQDRKAWSLSGIKFDEKLAEVARSHSDDMMRNKFFAHISPTRGALDARMAGASLTAMRFAENIAQNRDLYSAEKGLMESPAHRRAILGDFDRIGIGITRNADGQLFITQNFAKDFPKVDEAEGPKSLLREINERRGENNLRPLVAMDVYSRIAKENSLTMRREGELGTDNAKRLLNARRTGMRFCQMMVFKSPGAPDVGTMAKILDKRFTVIGIGMAANQEDSAGGYLWTTILLVQQ